MQRNKVIGIALSIIAILVLMYMVWGYMVAQDQGVLDYMEDNPPTTITP